jgi:hypothetical protein
MKQQRKHSPLIKSKNPTHKVYVQKNTINCQKHLKPSGGTLTSNVNKDGIIINFLSGSHRIAKLTTSASITFSK